MGHIPVMEKRWIRRKSDEWAMLGAHSANTSTRTHTAATKLISEHCEVDISSPSLSPEQLREKGIGDRCGHAKKGSTIERALRRSFRRRRCKLERSRWFVSGRRTAFAVQSAVTCRAPMSDDERVRHIREPDNVLQRAKLAQCDLKQRNQGGRS